MKKIFFIVALVVFIFSLIYFFSGEKKETNLNLGDLNRISSFRQATFSKNVVTEESSVEFPGTFIFGASTEGLSITLLPSLPGLCKNYDTILTRMQHGNVVMLETRGETYGVMPKHIFGDDLDVALMLKEAGFNVSSKGDIVTVPISGDKIKGRLKLSLLDNLPLENLENSSCVVRTLNCYKGDPNLYQYRIEGTLHYINNTEKEFLLQYARDSQGKKVSQTATDGLFVIRVPDQLFNEIPGMSGGSVVVNIKGKEYFLGMNTLRIMFGAVSGKDTLRSTMIGIQPVLSRDI